MSDGGRGFRRIPNSTRLVFVAPILVQHVLGPDGQRRTADYGTCQDRPRITVKVFPFRRVLPTIESPGVTLQLVAG